MSMKLSSFNLFLKLAQNVGLISDEVQTKEFQEMKAILEGKIPKVICSRQIFEKLPAGSLIPICLLEVTYIKGFVGSSPALVFRFGTFDEQPMKDATERINFAKSIIDGSGYFASSYKIKEVSPGNVRTNIKNSNYGLYVGVTFE